jgi:hypothetical protein
VPFSFPTPFFTVDLPFLHSSWEQFPSIAWAAPTFDFPENMPETDSGHYIMGAASTQVKLCSYDEEEPAIWFRLVESQFAPACIKSHKLKYMNALVSLPKQVFCLPQRAPK